MWCVPARDSCAAVGVNETEPRVSKQVHSQKWRKQATVQCQPCTTQYSILFMKWLRLQRICLQCGRPGFDPWVGKIPWRRKWQPTPVFLPGKSHGQKSLVGYSPWGRRVRHSLATIRTHMNRRRTGTRSFQFPSFLLSRENSA